MIWFLFLMYVLIAVGFYVFMHESGAIGDKDVVARRVSAGCIAAVWPVTVGVKIAEWVDQ